MNAQQKAIALLLQLLAARPARRKELMKQQFSFVAVIRHEDVIVAHGEFFMMETTPFHEVVSTTSGVAFRNVLTGAMTFIPFVA